MKLGSLELMGAGAAAATIGGLIFVTDPLPVLQMASPSLLAGAVCCSALSLVCWSGVWVGILKKGNCNVPARPSLALSLASLVGLLTPMNLGTDLLRSLYGKKHLGLAYESTAAASVVTRTFRVHVTLLCMAITVAFASASPGSLKQPVTLAGMVLVGLLALLYSLRTRPAGRLARYVKIGDVARSIARIATRISLAERLAAYTILMMGYACEWLALHLSFVALGIAVTAADTMLLFLLVSVLARSLVIPQGFGVVEVSAGAALASMGLQAAVAGAILVLWALLRAGVPLTVAAASSLQLRAMRRDSQPAGLEVMP